MWAVLVDAANVCASEFRPCTMATLERPLPRLGRRRDGPTFKVEVEHVVRPFVGFQLRHMASYRSICNRKASPSGW